MNNTQQISTEVTKLSGCKLKVKVNIEKQLITNFYNECCLEIQKNAKMPGFRKGTVPLDILKKQFSEIIKQKFIDKTIQETLPKAIENNKLLYVPNSIQITSLNLKEGENSNYEIMLECEPTFKLKSYKGLKLKKEIKKISQKDIDETLQQLREKNATIVLSEKKQIESNDILSTSNIFCIVNYKIFIDSQELKQYEGKNVLINLSLNALPTGFKEGLVGMFIGERKNINVEFPPNMSQLELMGKKGEMEVELVAIKEKKLPEINAEFATSLGYKSVEELTNSIKEILEKEAERETKQNLKNQIYEILLKEHDFFVPETEIKKHKEEIVEELKKDFLSRGMKESEFNLSEEQQKQIQKKAEDEVKLKYILKKIIETEKIQVTKEELDKEKGKLLALYPTKEQDINKYFEENINSFASKILEEKLIDLILSEAKIKEIEVKR
ncbi:MAG: trigger factor [Endomicrobia bacterium]|nr:trigger factor [Endomicrobiia bacterium]